MSKKYHVNPETGEVGVCKAHQRECRYGGDDYGSKYHFDSMERAQFAGEKVLGNKYDVVLRKSQDKGEYNTKKDIRTLETYIDSPRHKMTPQDATRVQKVKQAVLQHLAERAKKGGLASSDTLNDRAAAWEVANQLLKYALRKNSNLIAGNLARAEIRENGRAQFPNEGKRFSVNDVLVLKSREEFIKKGREAITAEMSKVLSRGNVEEGAKFVSEVDGVRVSGSVKRSTQADYDKIGDLPLSQFRSIAVPVEEFDQKKLQEMPMEMKRKIMNRTVRSDFIQLRKLSGGEGSFRPVTDFGDGNDDKKVHQSTENMAHFYAQARDEFGSNHTDITKDYQSMTEVFKANGNPERPTVFPGKARGNGVMVSPMVNVKRISTIRKEGIMTDDELSQYTKISHKPDYQLAVEKLGQKKADELFPLGMSYHVTYAKE